MFDGFLTTSYDVARALHYGLEQENNRREIHIDEVRRALAYFDRDSHLPSTTRLVPRLLTFLGFAGAAFIFPAALLELFGAILQFSVWGAALALPVFAYEMSLAVWHIVKGFDESAVESLDADVPTRAAAAE